MITSKSFYEKSIGYALSAIEIYNKPDFKQRSEVFSILLINAWESLLKGKLLIESGENIEILYINDGKGGYKTNRNGSLLTLEIIGCAKKIGLPDIVINNLISFIEVRDSSIHFVNEESIDYLVFTLGTAAIKNYHNLCKEWFGDGIDNYNFYILPMGFVYNFKSIQMIELSKEPEVIQNLLNRITECQIEVNKTPFEFVCEIEVNLKSAKKITSSTDLEVSVSPDFIHATTIIRDREIVDRYKLTATELYKNVKSKLNDLNRTKFFRYLKDRGIKDDPKYSGYLFRNRRQKERYEKDGTIPNGISSLYNHDCLRFVISDLQHKSK
ncbi:MAG: DUF3644 domain-containing protein [Bacteroidales bacterium]|nr:DUF3644 domain-containing protein [Bacteroidales bacterium]